MDGELRMRSSGSRRIIDPDRQRSLQHPSSPAGRGRLLAPHGPADQPDGRQRRSSCSARRPTPTRWPRLLERRLVARFPRFRQRVVEPVGRGPSFEDDPSFDVANHLHRLALPPPGDRAELQALVGDLITPPLDPDRPLWHVYLIEGYEGGAAVLWRIHHCIADGIALARVLLSITDGVRRRRSSRRRPASGRSALGRLAHAPRGAVSAVRGRAARRARGDGVARPPDHLRELAGTALRDASTAARLLAAPAEPATLRAPLTGDPQGRLVEPVPAGAVKEAAPAAGATINDLSSRRWPVRSTSSSAEDGACRRRSTRWSRSTCARSRSRPRRSRQRLRADPARAAGRGGRAGASACARSAAGWTTIKDSHEAPIAYGMLSAIGVTPPWVEDRLIGFFTDKASLVVTNVPGPRDPLSFAGAPITGVLVWAPCSGSLGMTVSIFSYAGEVTVGFMADTALTVDPEQLARAYEAELRTLVGSPGPARAGRAAGL